MDGVEMSHRAMFQTGWQIHAIHSMALLALALSRKSNKWLHGGFVLILAGVAAFCGPLYAPSLGIWVPQVLAAPVGGFFLVAGWLAVTFAGLSRFKTKSLGPTDVERIRRYYEGWAPPDSKDHK
jgi:uncharacterized membrane protein YgdD (TMEM256/DUF423 family)